MRDSQITAEQWLNKYSGSHTELAAIEQLQTSHQSLVKKDSTDAKMTYRNNKQLVEGEKKINQVTAEEKHERIRQLFFDLLQARLPELINKDDFPTVKLVETIVRMMPQKIEQKNENVHSFAEAVKRAKMEFESMTTLDAEGVPIVERNGK